MGKRRTEIDTNAFIGARIREYRQMAHITSEQLAACIGKTVKELNAIERGDVLIYAKDVWLIGRVLHVSDALLMPETFAKIEFEHVPSFWRDIALKGMTSSDREEITRKLNGKRKAH